VIDVGDDRDVAKLAGGCHGALRDGNRPLYQAVGNSRKIICKIRYLRV
jgi:hypothetical protein